MNLNYDTFIKQEIFNAEDDLLTTIPANTINPNLNIPVKNEPITDEITPLPLITTIKSEPHTQQTFMEEAGLTIKTENHNQNQPTIPGDSFIIYELETPTTATLPLLPSTHNLQNDKELFGTTSSVQVNTQMPALTVIPNETVAVKTTSPLQTYAPTQAPVTNETIPAKVSAAASSSAPPVLLNAQLRKRHKVVLPVNPIDKRTRYNIEGTKTNNLNKPTTNPTKSNKILNQCRSLNAGNKKIINHLIKHKQLNQSKPKGSLSTIPTEILEKPVATITQPRLSPITLPHIEQTTNANTLKEIKQEISTSPPLKTPAKIENSSLPLTKETKDPSPPTLMPELRVKCLCSLTAAGVGDCLNDNSELKDFFQKMFEETRRLKKTQQRKVKMLLLQAVSDAEELMEQGKCCGF